MATLVVPGRSLASHRAEQASEAVALRSWLDHGWTLLFSHPDDFVLCELESDRWLAIIRSALISGAVRPLALARPGRPLDAGWVTQVTGDERAVLIDEPGNERSPDWLDLGARRLLDQITAIRERFVMLIDPTLRVRRTYTYGLPQRLPSPLELVRWVSSLRGTREPADAAGSAIRERVPGAIRRPFEGYAFA